MCRENVNKLIHLFLLALFLSYYGSITFFSHYHVVNGVTIVHSHFFCGHADADGKDDASGEDADADPVIAETLMEEDGKRYRQRS